MPSDLTIDEKAEKLGLQQCTSRNCGCNGTTWKDHANDRRYHVSKIAALYAERFPAPDYRAALTPTTDGEREAREALSATEAPPTHHHSWRLYCFNHGHSVDTSTGSTEPPTWATWSRPCRRCDAMGEDCREFGVDHSEWDTDPPQTVAADHLRTALALLAAERAKAADAAREREAWVCNCGLPMSRNPHPDAGKPAALLDVGAVWVCIPCTVKSRHGATTARFQAERDRDGERAAIVAWLRGPCNDPVHDDRWCPTCEARSDYADAIERGAHTKVTP